MRLPRFATRWLLLAREAALLEQAQRGETVVREDRARLQQTYRELRHCRACLAEVTPARTLLKQALQRRAGELGEPVKTAGFAPRRRSIFWRAWT